MKVIIVITGLVSLPLFAETVVLKTGAVIEAPIANRSETALKVDIDGLLITYYLDEIESIDGQRLAAEEKPAETTLEASSEDSIFTGTPFDDWLHTSGISDYLDQMELIENRLRLNWEPVSNMMAAVAEGDDPDMFSKALTAIKEVNDSILEEMRKLKVPSELAQYHDMQLSVCEDGLRASAALMAKDITAAQTYHRKMSLTLVAAVRELQRIYSAHGAPEALLATLEAQIVRLSKETEPEEQPLE